MHGVDKAGIAIRHTEYVETGCNSLEAAVPLVNIEAKSCNSVA
jgi:hypothetical protein